MNTETEKRTNRENILIKFWFQIGVILRHSTPPVNTIANYKLLLHAVKEAMALDYGQRADSTSIGIGIVKYTLLLCKYFKRFE